MHLLRCLFFVRAHFQMKVTAVHVPQVANTLADAISCNNLLTLFSQVLGVAGRKAAIPADLLSQLVEHQPRLDVSGLDQTVRQLFSADLAPATRKNLWCEGAAIPWFLSAILLDQPLPNVGTSLRGFCGILISREAVSLHGTELPGRSEVCPDCSRFGGPLQGRDAPSEICGEEVATSAQLQWPQAPQAQRLPITPGILKQLQQV